MMIIGMNDNGVTARVHPVVFNVRRAGKTSSFMVMKQKNVNSFDMRD
jgi:hypothetical protein